MVQPRQSIGGASLPLLRHQFQEGNKLLGIGGRLCLTPKRQLERTSQQPSQPRAQHQSPEEFDQSSSRQLAPRSFESKDLKQKSGKRHRKQKQECPSGAIYSASALQLVTKRAVWSENHPHNMDSEYQQRVPPTASNRRRREFDVDHERGRGRASQSRSRSQRRVEGYDMPDIAVEDTSLPDSPPVQEEDRTHAFPGGPTDLSILRTYPKPTLNPDSPKDETLVLPQNISNLTSSMKLPPFLLRPISQFSSTTSKLPPLATAYEITTHEEVLSIINSSTPMEPELEKVVPFLLPDIVNSVFQEQLNPELGFRFFVWASKRRKFRCWVSFDFIIDMLVKDNGFELYWKTLEELKSCGVPISSDAFTVLISGYWKLRMAEKAVEAFGRMKDFDCKPDLHTYNMILHVMVEKEVILLALAVYNVMLKSNCAPNCATYSILIDGLCKSGKTQDALKLFDEMTQRGIPPNRITFTVIISGLCKSKRADEAHRLFNTMKRSGCSPDTITYNALLNGFCKLGKVDEAFMLCSSFKKEGYALGINGYSCLIDGLFRARRYNEAHDLFQKMSEENIIPDLVLYTIMIRGLAEAGKVKDALKLVEGDDGERCGTRYSRNGLVGEAREIFNEMEKVGCFPSVVTFNALIDGLCKDGDLDEAHLLFYKMEIGRNPSLFLRLSQGTDRVLDSASLQTMVAKLCDSGLILKAYKLLMQLADSGVLPNITTYNILINGFSKARNINREEDAFGVFDQMKKNGCMPSSAVYKSLMTWSCRKKKISVAFSIWLKYLRSLPGRDEEAIKVAEEHFEKGELEKAVRGLLELDFKVKDFDSAPYTIWIIGLCQARKLDEALKLFSILAELGDQYISP
ncbi:hypothetical protein HYC85_022366 [Camellia sinensis]|uniref:Pentacotripeptide-repeat region of PRORP domain-containing protein n=1 Tax=Camellia sinensis TaxID=4442 RepID=A0A7J7GK82_CAMSI|nr:hypothetical protein HYC85_022366 [Camellia sinensis]